MKISKSNLYDTSMWERITRGLQLLFVEWKGDYKCEPEEVYHFVDANAISSWNPETDRHIVAIDIDMPAVLVPSTTEGKFHLYIEKELETEQYMHLLRVLADYGIIEEGYFNASEQRGYSALRLPWVKKREGE